MPDSIADTIAQAVAQSTGSTSTESAATDAGTQTGTASVADAIAGAITEATAGKTANDAADTARVTAIETRLAETDQKLDAILAALQAGTAPAKTETQPTETAGDETEETTSLVTALEAQVTDLAEAGRVLSAASKQKVQAAHDALARLGNMPCVPDTDNDGESVRPTGISASEVKALVAEAVSKERETFEAKLAEAETRHKTEIDNFLTARRKSHAVTETESEGALEKAVESMSLGQLLAAHIGASSK